MASLAATPEARNRLARQADRTQYRPLFFLTGVNLPCSPASRRLKSRLQEHEVPLRGLAAECPKGHFGPLLQRFQPPSAEGSNLGYSTPPSYTPTRARMSCLREASLISEL